MTANRASERSGTRATVRNVPDPFVDELRVIADRLREIAARGDDAAIAQPLQKVMDATGELGKAWSGSNMGYQSRVYYDGLKPPPPGAHFDSEWGFLGQFQGTTGDWREFDFDEIVKLVYELAGVESLDEPARFADEAASAVAEAKPDVPSVLGAWLTRRQDPLIEELRGEAEKVKVPTEQEAQEALVGTIGAKIVRDTTALSQGFRAAPHQFVEARAITLSLSFRACDALASAANRAASHMARLETSQSARGQEPVAAGENVFIGHGQSGLWHELKDFISERVRLPWDEYNRVPVAGVTNIARLSEMLDNAGIAFLVLTAEDEMADGAEQARQNVVHEAGLFQGRLGFARAIVLLEEGCEEFSNIQGLGQIRFPAGKISTAFEEIRRVLERENFIVAQ